MDALSSCGDLLLEYGGHELAAGLSIERGKIDEFRKKLNEYAAPILGECENLCPLEIECVANFSDLSERGIDEVLKLEPFGLSNPQPILILKNALLRDIVPLSQGKHIRARLCGNENGKNYSLNTVSFGTSYDDFPYCEGDRCDVVFTVDMNEYMGSRTPQLFIKDIALSEKDRNSVENCEKSYASLLDGIHYEGCENDIPDLSEFRTIFRYIRREAGHEGRLVSLTSIKRSLEREFEIKVSLCKLKIIFEVLSEQNLISISYREGNNSVFIKMIPSPGKINIDESPLLRTIRSGCGK